MSHYNCGVQKRSETTLPVIKDSLKPGYPGTRVRRSAPAGLVTLTLGTAWDSGRAEDGLSHVRAGSPQGDSDSHLEELKGPQ
eukprot:2166050-Rhodomonas_salina.1